MLDAYPGHPVLIGEVVEPTTAGLDRLYGGTAKDGFQLPMDYIFAVAAEGTSMVDAKTNLSAMYYRQHLLAAECQLHGSQTVHLFRQPR